MNALTAGRKKRTSYLKINKSNNQLKKSPFFKKDCNIKITTKKPIRPWKDVGTCNHF